MPRAAAKAPTKRPAKAPVKRRAKTGRPTTYDTRYCAELVTFFERPVVRERVETVEGKNWSKDTLVREAIFFPSIERFAAMIGVHKDTLYEWGKVHKSFSDALTRAHQIQHSLIYEYGITGQLDSRMAALFAQTNMGWKQKSEADDQQTIIIKHEDQSK